MSIYEEVSVIIGQPTCEEIFRNYGVGGVISKKQKSIINRIIDELRNLERTANSRMKFLKFLKLMLQMVRFQKSGNIADLYLVREAWNILSIILTIKTKTKHRFLKKQNKASGMGCRKRRPIKAFYGFLTES